MSKPIMGKNIQRYDAKEVREAIIESISFYKDKDNESTIYARYYFDDHFEFSDIYNTRFRAFLNHRYRTEMNDPYAVVDFSSLINAKKDETILYGDSIKPYTRLAGNSNYIVYFLADEKWNCVIVTKSGWQVIQQTKFMFVKKNNTENQVLPLRCNQSLDSLLKPFINMKDDDYTIFKINLIQYFFNSSSHFISIISSEHGTGKSTLTRLIREIVDPAVAPQAYVPDTPEEIKNHLANNMFVAFDNTKQQKDIVSDILCGATTGTALTKRTLYTTSEETILNIKNIIVLNGIDIVPHKSDLLERSLLFELNKISSSNRKNDRDFWKEFKSKKPYILGCIFDIISKAIMIRKSLALKETHRMSDAYTDMCAIALAIGIDIDIFRKIFYANRKKLEGIYSEQNPFILTIVDFMISRGNKPIKGTMSNVYQAIKEYKNINNKYLPQSASAFSRKLRTEEGALKEAGYKFYCNVKNDATYVMIEKIKEKEKKRR